MSKTGSDNSNLVLTDGRCLVFMSCINECSLKTPFTSYGAELFSQVCKKQRPQKLWRGRSESVIPGTWKCPLVVYEVNSLAITQIGNSLLVQTRSTSSTEHIIGAQ